MLRSNRTHEHEYKPRSSLGTINNPSQVEQSLVQRAKRGDRAAFAQIYDTFVDRIYKYAYYRVGHSNDAEDITAQVFIKAWQAIGRYETMGRPFAAWLYRIAHNQIVDFFRARRETAPLESANSQISSFDVEDMILRHAQADLLREAIKHLSPDQQAVIALRFLEGWGTEEAAHIMGKTPGAVRTLQHRALARLNQIVRSKPE